MRTIRASEIGVYIFCHRAWWYQGQGVASENQLELASGTALHRQHSRRVLAAGLLRGLALAVLLAAVVALTLSIIQLFL